MSVFATGIVTGVILTVFFELAGSILVAVALYRSSEERSK